MNNSLYLRLAVTNMKKNAKSYIPYLLTCIGTVMMYYIMVTMSGNEGFNRMQGGDNLRTILSLGTYLIAIFAVIFLFYTNHFLIKQRKKEFGLFHILGMEKRHLSRMLWWETFLTAVIGLGAGIVLGILFNKLMFMILLKILHFSVPMGFSVSLGDVINTLILFGLLFAAILLNTMAQIYFTKPIELLKGGEIGEREPKTKWLMVLVGILSLGSGYYIAMTTEEPLAAINLFFVAVILVVLGTYCLFTAISVAVLKLLRRNKKYYYKTKHFIAVSGMIHRMKQNAVGLANICILSTMVLVTVSTTVSLYIGMEDVLRGRYARNVEITSCTLSEEYNEEARNIAEKTLEEHHLIPENWIQFRSMIFVGEKKEDSFQIKEDMGYFLDIVGFNVIPLADYNKITGREVSLEEDEILICLNGEAYKKERFTIFHTSFFVKEDLKELFADAGRQGSAYEGYYAVVKDTRVAEKLAEEARMMNDALPGRMDSYIGFDLETEDEEVLRVCEALNGRLKEKYPDAYIESAAMSKESFFALYGGLFFLGIFLGVIFIMATVLIIYYKQISEGYEDKGRFDIMQKVGMSREEIRSTIRGQVLMVFFLPLVTAVIHIAFAFRMITKLLVTLNLNNVRLFGYCTAGTILMFALLYGLVYGLTAREYYKIVK